MFWIPVIMYHRVYDPQKDRDDIGIGIPINRFILHCKLIKYLGYRTLTINEYLNILYSYKVPPKGCVLLTFDDGYLDVYTNAYPILKKYKLRAIIFAMARDGGYNTWDKQEHPPLMTFKQMREMLEDGFEFGVHGVNHINYLNSELEDIKRDVFESKYVLEKSLGTSMKAFAYPYGICPEYAKSIVKEAGFMVGFSVNTGPLDMRRDLFEIRRIGIFPNTGIIGLWKKLQPWYPKYKLMKADIEE